MASPAALSRTAHQLGSFVAFTHLLLTHWGNDLSLLPFRLRYRNRFSVLKDGSSDESVNRLCDNASLVDHWDAADEFRCLNCVTQRLTEAHLSPAFLPSSAIFECLLRQSSVFAFC